MGSVRIRVSSRTAGGLADHLPSEVLKQWLDESKKAIGDRAAEQLRAFSMDKTGRATGRYQAGIRETVLGNGDVRVDDPVVYGPWLEGVSQRNNSTRFKGYHLWRKTRDSVNRQAVGIAEEKLAPYIEELGGS